MARPKWRLIVDMGNGYWNMAVDEAMLILRDRGEIPNTIRLYAFRPSCVTIGYFQKVAESVNLDYVRQRGIPVVRRVTGGGSVYHDEHGEVTYCVVADISEFPGSIEDSYRRICSALVRAVRSFGLPAEFKPVNDVVIRGRKVSGSAQARRSRALMQHGTLMYDTNLEELARVLRAPAEKLRAHGVSSIYERVTTLSRELGRKVRREEVVGALVRAFEVELGVRLARGSYTRGEEELARQLLKKYRSEEWLYRR